MEEAENNTDYNNEEISIIDFLQEKDAWRGSTAIERMELFTQDNGIVSCDSSRRREILEAEQFIRSLPELTYYVTKINQWGKHQSRQLRLTSDGIDNIRNQVVSSTYKYSDVVTVSMRNINTFVLQYTDATHDYVYRSPVAMQIVQEISTRIAIRRTTDKKKLTYDIALDYQKKLKEEGLEESVTEDSLTTPTSSPTSTTSGSPSSSGSGSSVSSSDGEKYGPHKKRATKLMKILGNTESQRLQNEVDRLLLSANMPEGRTVNQFVADFHVLMKSPATAPLNVRRFIDSLRSHILEKRGSVLSKLIVNDDQLSNQFSLTHIIELSLEKSVIVRLQKPIFTAIQTQARADDDLLATRAAQLRYKPQSFFGIPTELQSASNWSSAVLELSCINRCETPVDKSATILAAAKSIYNSAYHDLSKGVVKKDYYLSADDFLPIYIYVVINSDIVDMESTSQFLWLLSDPNQLSGESGYYLTVFSSVISLLKSLDISKIDTALTIDELINSNTTTDETDDLASGNTNGTKTETGYSAISQKWSRGVQKWNRSMMAVKTKIEAKTRKVVG